MIDDDDDTPCTRTYDGARATFSLNGVPIQGSGSRITGVESRIRGITAETFLVDDIQHFDIETTPLQDPLRGRPTLVVGNSAPNTACVLTAVAGLAVMSAPVFVGQIPTRPTFLVGPRFPPTKIRQYRTDKQKNRAKAAKQSKRKNRKK